MKEVRENDYLFILMDADARTRRRGGGKLGSEECNVLEVYGRDTLKDNGQQLLSCSANHGLALLNAFFSTAKNAIFARSTGEAKNLASTASATMPTKGSLEDTPRVWRRIGASAIKWGPSSASSP